MKNLAQILRNERKARREADTSLRERLLARQKEDTQDLLSTRQGLSHMDTHWQSLPHTCPQLVNVHNAAHMSELATHGPPSALSSLWNEQHVGIPRSSWTYSSEKKAKISRCFAHGFCHCKGIGARVARIKAKLASHLQGCCENSELHRDMLHGHLVLQLQSRSRADSASSSSEPKFDRNHWYHIPLFQAKPWRPTFMEMELHRDVVSVQWPDLHGQVRGASAVIRPCVLKSPDASEGARLPFATVWQLCSSLDQSQDWAAQCWRLSRRCSPAGDKSAVIATIAETPSAVIWSLAMAKARKKEKGTWQADTTVTRLEPSSQAQNSDQNDNAALRDHESEPEDPDDSDVVSQWGNSSDNDMDQALHELIGEATGSGAGPPQPSNSSASSSSKSSSSSSSSSSSTSSSDSEKPAEKSSIKGEQEDRTHVPRPKVKQGNGAALLSASQSPLCFTHLQRLMSLP